MPPPDAHALNGGRDARSENSGDEDENQYRARGPQDRQQRDRGDDDRQLPDEQLQLAALRHLTRLECHGVSAEVLPDRSLDLSFRNRPDHPAALDAVLENTENRN